MHSQVPAPQSSQSARPVSPARGGSRVFALSRLFGVVCVALLVLAGCGGGGSSATSGGPKTGGALTVGLDSDVVTLDPLKSTALVDREVMLNIYDTLVRVDDKNNVQPDLATSWTTSSDGKQVTFTLRSGVKFQDGTPFNADAVVTNIQRILTTKSSPRHSELSTVDSVAKVDDTHVVFNLKSAFSPLLLTLTDRAGMILSPAVIQSAGDNLGNAPTGAGTGPFQFDSWVKGDHMTVKANPSYWQKDSAGRTLPYLASVTYKPITNESVMFTNLQTGAIQVAQDVDPKDIPAVKNNSSLVYKQTAGLSFFGFELNTKSAPLNDVHFRRAIAYAVNRDEILNSVLQGVGVTAQGPLSPSSWAFNQNGNYFTNDISKAKAELAQSSSPTGGSFDLLVASGSPLNLQEAQFIQSELKPANITVNIKTETFATILSDTTAFKFQAALIGWSGRPDPDGNTFSWFHTGGGNNDMQYSNATVDKLLEDARVQSDQSKRAQDYVQAEQQIASDAPYVFINHGVSTQISSAKVQNFQLLPTGIMVFTQTYLS
ncbi:MAG TPA: ABC transporter substrate-binding protein [Ktedonobacterales bacterium]|jgi:peptide/nickel transport system substrate-binding protein|nr:ABC transporter substrate-binding protein [Ktedonobacterales bacterium]